MEKYLNQVSCVENTEENGVFFDELVKDIKTGNGCCAMKKLVTLPNSDRDLLTYEDILDSARTLDERIVYDDMFYVLTASKDIITLYEYCKVEDMLGDTLEEGDEVLWADPDDSARDLNRVWKVYDIHSPELVKISAGKVGKRGYSEAEVPPCELVKKSSIIRVKYDAGCGSMG
jgi:hypothetical protein